MTREFLKNYGLEDSAIDRILQENTQDINAAKADLADVQGKLTAAQSELDTLKQSNGDIAALQQQYNDLQAKYDTDIAERDEKLADRDYSDAIRAAITGKGLKFSSKSAEKAFTASLKEKKLELKDGELTGIDDFIKEQRESDPDAFAPDKPVPRFVGPTGVGSTPPAPLPANVVQAKALGAAKAAVLKASNDAMAKFM